MLKTVQKQAETGLKPVGKPPRVGNLNIPDIPDINPPCANLLSQAGFKPGLSRV